MTNHIEKDELPEIPKFTYMTVSEQNRMSILNIQAELLAMHGKIDLILEAIKK